MLQDTTRSTSTTGYSAAATRCCASRRETLKGAVLSPRMRADSRPCVRIRACVSCRLFGEMDKDGDGMITKEVCVRGGRTAQP